MLIYYFLIYFSFVICEHKFYVNKVFLLFRAEFYQLICFGAFVPFRGKKLTNTFVLGIAIQKILRKVVSAP
jgi:hypothetical protein